MNDSRLPKVQASLIESWNKYTNLPLAILSLVYFILYSYEVVYKPAGISLQIIEISNTSIWVIFSFDIILKFIARTSLESFVKSYWLEILALTLPFIRFLRVFRLLLAIRAFRAISKSRRDKTIFWTLVLLPLAWFVGSIAILDAESSSSNASIVSLDQALWWALTTISTVGDGDLYPTTLEGRFVAGILMVFGIALFSAAAGILVSWLLQGEKGTNTSSN
jgi:voltage-gated potassium channel